MHTAAHLLARGETVIGIDDFNDYYPVALKEARVAELATIGGDRLAIHRADIGDEAALAKACVRKAQLNLLPMQDGNVHETYADIAAIERKLGYKPETDIRVGVGNFVAWYRQFHGV